MSATGWEILLGSAFGALSASVPVTVQAWLARREKVHERKYELKKRVFLEGASGLERRADLIVCLANAHTRGQEQANAAAEPTGWTTGLMMSIEQESTARSVAAAFMCANEAVANLSWSRARIATLDARLAAVRQQSAYWQGLCQTEGQREGQNQNAVSQVAEGWRRSLELDSKLAGDRVREAKALFQKGTDWLGKYRELLATAVIEMRKELDLAAGAWLPAVVSEVQEKDREITARALAAVNMGDDDVQ